MHDLLDYREFRFLVEYLLNREHHGILCPLRISMCQLRYLKSLNFGHREAILLLVHLDPQVPLLGRLVIACVNDEVILPLDLRAVPLEVVVENPIQVHVQTHELRQ